MKKLLTFLAFIIGLSCYGQVAQKTVLVAGTNITLNQTGNTYTVNATGGGGGGGTVTTVTVTTANGVSGTVTNPTTTPAITLSVTPNGIGAWGVAGNALGVDTKFLGSTDNFDVLFKTNNTERARFLKGGDFGIGTATPTSRLHVSQTISGTAIAAPVINVNNELNINSSANVSDNIANTLNILTVTGSSDYAKTPTAVSNSFIHNGTGNLTDAAFAASNIFTNSNSGTVTNGISLFGITENTAAGNITNAVGVAATVMNPGAGTITEATSIYAFPPDANVGTVTNRYGLRVADMTGFGTNHYNIYSEGATSNNVFQGNVGIGTGTVVPSTLLDLGLAGTTKGVMRFAGNTSGNVTLMPLAAAGTYTITLPPDDGTSGQFLHTDGSGVTSWQTAASSQWITATTPTTAITYTVGNVGIGTMSVSATLHAQATNTTTVGLKVFKLTSTTNDSIFAVHNSGQIYAGSSGNNLFMGKLSGLNWNGGGVGDNTSFGVNAMTSLTSGQYNNAFGFQALYSNTSGSNNDAFGLQALYSNTTGTQNCAFGYATLYSNTTGVANSAFGLGAMNLNTTGHENSAFGKYALTANTTGFDNVGLGYRALYTNTTGQRNTVIGKDALNSCVAGISNVAIGANCGALSTGSRNIFIGESAGAYSGVGVNDIFVLDNRLRADAPTEKANSIIFGEMAASVASQTLRFNALTGILTGTVAPATALQVNGGITITPITTQTLTASSTTVTVGNCSYIRISSDNATPANRLLVLPQSTSAGQILIIEFVGATNACEIVDDAAQGTNGNMRLAGNFDMAEYDTIKFISNGTDWIETGRSNN